MIVEASVRESKTTSWLHHPSGFSLNSHVMQQQMQQNFVFPPRTLRFYLTSHLNRSFILCLSSSLVITPHSWNQLILASRLFLVTSTSSIYVSSISLLVVQVHPSQLSYCTGKATTVTTLQLNSHALWHQERYARSVTHASSKWVVSWRSTVKQVD